jgi:hypothetical protein
MFKKILNLYKFSQSMLQISAFPEKVAADTI